MAALTSGWAEEDPDQEQHNQESARNEPNRSIYNLIFFNEDDDENVSLRSSRSYLEEEVLPLPDFNSSDTSSAGCSGCGQCECCECCAQRRRKKLKCNSAWVKNVVYYMLMNGLLIAFFFFLLYMCQVNYYQDPESPPFKQLLFKHNQYPGLSIIPCMYNINVSSGAILWYTMQGRDTPKNRRHFGYVAYISKILYDQQSACQTAKKCIIQINQWGPCQSPDFGYEDKKPCLYLKLNKLTLWEPEEYGSLRNIPKDVPAELQQVINPNRANIWVHCKGVDYYDDEKIGEINYFPGPYFESHFFPIDALRNENPIIAIKLDNYQVGFLVRITCGMYAKNVHVHRAFTSYVYIKP